MKATSGFSGAEDSTTSGGSSEVSTDRSDPPAVNNPNPLTNPILRSPVKKNNKDASATKLRTEHLANSATKRKEEVRDFKHSVCYRALEQAVLIGEDLVEREEEIEVSEGIGFRKLELDSDTGATTCRNFLVCVERIFETLQITPVNKEYRTKFSKAYKVLYS
jgi:hypothetical protein